MIDYGKNPLGYSGNNFDTFTDKIDRLYDKQNKVEKSAVELVGFAKTKELNKGASEEGVVVTNGMSNFARNGKNANSALVVQIKKADFDGEDPLAGVRFQQKLERRAFEYGGRNYKAPVQLVGDFVKGRVSERFVSVLPTYDAGKTFAPLDEVLPSVVADSLKASLPDIGRRLKGFDCPDVIMTGVESRTSSPVRITRGETLESVSVGGIYPCGEGFGNIHSLFIQFSLN